MGANTAAGLLLGGNAAVQLPEREPWRSWNLLLWFFIYLEFWRLGLVDCVELKLTGASRTFQPCMSSRQEMSPPARNHAFLRVGSGVMRLD